MDRAGETLTAAVVTVLAILLLFGRGESPGPSLPAQGAAPGAAQAAPASLAQASSEPMGIAYYQVQRGDTLFSLARRFGTSVAALQALNALDDPDRLQAGQLLQVPAAAGVVSGSEAPHGAAQPGEAALPALAAGPDNLEPAGRPLSPDREDVWWLARLIHLEARGEPFWGQVAVGAVVVNRVRDPRFPKRVVDVITQPGQFGFAPEAIAAAQPGETALAAARLALSGVDPTGGALFFYNPDKTVTPEFWATRPALARIGAHVFTR